jgi:uncharacterized protein YjbI with pentapeptide repeats
MGRLMKLHALFLDGDPKGQRLDLGERDLGQFRSDCWDYYDFSQANFFHCKFEGSNFQECQFTRATLVGALFCNTNLWRADLTGARCDGARFINVDLRGAHFTTELLSAARLLNIVCNDEQLPWLIGHKEFTRMTPELFLEHIS